MQPPGKLEDRHAARMAPRLVFRVVYQLVAIGLWTLRHVLLCPPALFLTSTTSFHVVIPGGVHSLALYLYGSAIASTN
ncbi:hypothetical protein EDD15DRAFT_2317882 [Pisolithus albus]|nr:hypothetical protein EDD15DRAFT_2317882 [Pisolithus albus]